jgi:hypothetical protein
MRLVISLTAMLTLVACNTTPIDASLIDQPDELRQGGGILSGPSGNFSKTF